MERTEINKFGLPNIVIPAEVIYNDNLTWREKALFGFIQNLAANEHGYCWACNRYLGQHIKVRPETISTMISKLHKEEYLSILYETKHDGTQIRKISIDLTYLQKYQKTLQTALSKILRPLKQNLKTPSAKSKNPFSKTLSKLDIKLDIKLNNNIYTLFLEKWNEQKIILHKKITSKKESSIKKALKDFSQEEIFKSFQNYATVLHSPDYFWNYTWTMEDFLQRGLHRFVDEAKPLTNLKNNFSPDYIPPLSETKLSPSGFPLITHSYDRTCKTRKTIKEWQIIFEDISNKLINNPKIWRENHKPDKITVFNGVVSMQKWLDNVDYSLYGGDALWHRIKPLNKLIDYYILCIDDWWDWIGGVKDNVFDANNKIFKMFIHELENSFAVKIDIKSKGWENDSDWTPRN